MKKDLTPLERFLSKKLKRKTRLRSGINPGPIRFLVNQAIKVLVPQKKWEFGSCRRVLMHATSGEMILFVKKIGRR